MALDYAKKSREINDSEELHFLFAEIFAKQNDFANAIKEYNYLIMKNPQNIEYTIALANLYVTQHKYPSARKVLKNYIKQNPNEKNNPRLQPYGILRFGL